MRIKVDAYLAESVNEFLEEVIQVFPDIAQLNFEGGTIEEFARHCMFLGLSIFKGSLEQEKKNLKEKGFECSHCFHVVEVEEWDSDRVVAWECANTEKRVNPDLGCGLYEKVNIE